MLGAQKAVHSTAFCVFIVNIATMTVRKAAGWRLKIKKNMKKGGPEEQFLGWYDQFADAIFRHCFFRLSDREKAKDVTQETFMRLWKYLAEGKEIANARAFLYRIANNLVIDEYRKKEMFSLDQMQEETGFDIGFDPKRALESRDEFERAQALIEQIPDPSREALVMRHIDGFSVKEIARITHESENVISVRIHRAMEKLKTLAQNYEHHH